MAAINKKKWFIGIMGVAVLISAILFWFFFVIPNLFKLQKDFTYEAEVLSSDNFYNEAKGEFSGASISATKFSYSVIGEQNGVLTIKNTFDVHKLTGEPIFSVERLYGIDPITGKHVAGFGDKNRDGYLFAPKGLKKGEPFTYWHINYDGPAHMQFAGEETINGLTVYRYETHYEGVTIDQTKNLGFLPGVGVTRGVNLDPYLQLWIEPQTGTLINYKDETTAYYYDLQTGKRLYPWNKFSNTFKHSSITTQVEIAKQKKLFIFVINLGVLIAIILIAFITILVWSLWHLYTAKKDAVKNLKKFEEQQVILQSEQVKLKNATTIVSVQNTQLKETVADLEKSKKATLNILEDLQVERRNLNQAKARDEAILASIGDGLVAVDKEGKILMVNNAFENLVGWKGKEVLGKLLVEIVPREDETGNIMPFNERILTKVLSSSSSSTTTTTTWYYTRKDKTRFPAASIITPFILEGKIIGAIEVFRDITEELRAQKITEKQLLQEITLEKKEKDFLSMASHQLMTPLALIEGYLSMMMSGKYGTVDTAAKNYLSESLGGAQRMSQLIKTFLTTSSLESGTIKTEKTVFDLDPLIKEVCHEFAPKAEEKGLRLECGETLKIEVVADKNHTREILTNLINNAIKYTNTGSVSITSKIVGEKAYVSIIDTGVGISKANLPNIFEKFNMSENWIKKQSESNGLGLYISRLLINLMGGTISVESNEGNGSTFTLVLPLAKTE